MAQTDDIAVEIDGADLKAVQDAIDVLNTKLLPKLKFLSPQDRRELPKMGDKSVAFVQKGLEYATRHAGLRPAYLDLAAYEIDVNAVNVLRNLEQSLTPVFDAIGDTLTLSGSEAYQATLVFYNSAKAAAKLKIAGAQGVYTDMAARFPGASSQSKGASTLKS